MGYYPTADAHLRTNNAGVVTKQAVSVLWGTPLQQTHIYAPNVAVGYERQIRCCGVYTLTADAHLRTNIAVGYKRQAPML